MRRFWRLRFNDYGLAFRDMLKWRIKEIVKQLVNIAWMCIPKRIQTKVHEKHDAKAAEREMEVYASTNVSEQEVTEAFAALGIQGDVLVHSSLIHIGNIKGKHKPIVKALQEHVLDKGNTVLAIAIPIKGSTEEYLQSIDRFDKNAPIGMGVISTYYAKQEGTCRSLNPTHSVIAYGPRAEEYTKEHHLDKTPFTEKSPYYKLLEHNGGIVMIGAGIKHLTIMHIVEDMLGDIYPQRVYGSKEYPVDIYRDEECIYHGTYKAHSKWSGALRVTDYVQSRIKALPSTKVVKLGGAELIYINARDAVICELEELKKGNSIYGWRHISEELRAKSEEWIERIKGMKE